MWLSTRPNVACQSTAHIVGWSERIATFPSIGSHLCLRLPSDKQSWYMGGKNLKRWVNILDIFTQTNMTQDCYRVQNLRHGDGPPSPLLLLSIRNSSSGSSSFPIVKCQTEGKPSRLQSEGREELQRGRESGFGSSAGAEWTLLVPRAHPPPPSPSIFLDVPFSFKFHMYFWMKMPASSS